jgi:hypothetical protein
LIFWATLINLLLISPIFEKETSLIKRKVSKPFTNLLHVMAVDHSCVRETEPDGSILPGLRFVGKTFIPESYQEEQNGTLAYMEHQVNPNGVKVPYSAYYVNEIKLGHLLPVDAITASLAGVPLPKSEGK